MASPDIPAAKRDGLRVDLDRLAREGDGWLSAEDRYALKTHGVCPQRQPGVFMIRVRVPGGVLLTEQARVLARLARRVGSDWLHLTTRQNVELHWVGAADLTGVLDELRSCGLSACSSCGHTLRNVMCSEDAGVGLDEPFDCFPDARAVSDAIVARSAELNIVLPSRVNLAFGGSPRCREDAPLNDGAFVSIVRAGVAGYEVWAGGSLGKSPRLGIVVEPFVPRTDVIAAAESLIEVFVADGDLDHPAKGRMKFVLDRMGDDGFVDAWRQAFAMARRVDRASGSAVDVTGDVDRADIVGTLPAGGWSVGVRPQRSPGRALVTIDIPLGDTCGSELELLADLADRHADGAMVVGRDQDLVLRDVAVSDVAAIRAAIGERGLHLLGEGASPRVRACTGSSVCAIGITDAPASGRRLAELASLRRNPAVRVHVSGCPNSCAQHQVGDVGLAGSKVRVGGRVADGYLVFVGFDPDRNQLGEVVGRVEVAEVPIAVDAIVGLWEATAYPRRTHRTHGAAPRSRRLRRLRRGDHRRSFRTRQRRPRRAAGSGPPSHPRRRLINPPNIQEHRCPSPSTTRSIRAPTKPPPRRSSPGASRATWWPPCSPACSSAWPWCSC